MCRKSNLVTYLGSIVFALLALPVQLAASNSGETDPLDLSEGSQFATPGAYAPKGSGSSSSNVAAGRMSLDFSAPNGGSPYSEGAAGIRFFVQDDFALALAALYANDKELSKSSYGALLRMQAFFSGATKSKPYYWAGFSAGKNGGDGYSEQQKEAATGFSTGLGIELFLIKELSISGEVGLSSQITPAEKSKVVTGTSALALHLFLGE